MKAAIYHGPGDVRIEAVGHPTAGDNGIVIKVRAAGICGSDLHSYKVASSVPPAEKHAHGHEVAGDVVEIGANVKDVAVGDRVWAWPYLPCFAAQPNGH
jgi:threonine dehydrogenase-like Zn-dependent dehydrogenase